MKSSLREEYLERRQSLSSKEYNQACVRLANALIKDTDWAKVRCVHIYLPMLNKREFNTYLIIEHLQTNFPEINIVVPVADFKSKTMKSILIEESTNMIFSQHGIPEPKEGKEVASSEIDLVIAPLLVHDTNNYRLGYGGGFYDRFFHDIPEVKKVGLSFFQPISDMPREETDVPLDKVYV